MHHEAPSRLLFVSPILPAVTGNGLAMRAGATLQAFARQFRVTLLVVPRYPSPAGLSAEIRACCEEVAVVPAGAWDAAPVRHGAPRWMPRRARAGQAVRPRFRDEPYDVVHVFRLAAWPFACSWLDASPTPRRWLDLDDVESLTHLRLAALCRERGRLERAEAETAAAEKAAAQEDAALATFDRVFVGSEPDRSLLAGRGRADIRVLPNALPMPGPLPAPPSGDPPRLLFVGSLGYPPNDDAAIAICREVLPALRRLVGREATATIVGGGASGELERAAAEAGCTLTGCVAHLAPHYRDAHLAVLPIRAGGGTRIKAIEAFAYRRPVVSTALGVEGLDVEDGVHVLLGEDADEFAGQCLRVLSEPAFAAGLVARAWNLFVNDYSTDRLAAIVAALDRGSR
jgi:glycosyltransferase involved in cell wall biosynthesis